MLLKESSEGTTASLVAAAEPVTELEHWPLPRSDVAPLNPRSRSSLARDHLRDLDDEVELLDLARDR